MLRSNGWHLFAWAGEHLVKALIRDGYIILAWRAEAENVADTVWSAS